MFFLSSTLLVCSISFLYATATPLHAKNPVESVLEKRALSGHNYRILALGDSITNGYKSSDDNGYRQDLVNLLAGNPVDMINDGHNGAVITEIADFATPELKRRPHVVLLHAGTNDMGKNLDVGNAPARLGSLNDQISKACPDAEIFVALIIVSTDPDIQDRTVQYNSAVQAVSVDFSKVLNANNYAAGDNIHPNDQGYARMAQIWYDAMVKADSAGLIKDPVAGNGDVACAQAPTWIPQGEIANGAGNGKNIWPVNGSQSYDIAVHFADLNGDGRAEYLYVDDVGGITAFLNLGSSDPNGASAAKVGWLLSGKIASGGGGANRSTVQFADLNGDGQAEYLIVHPDGSVSAFLNLVGPDQGPNAAKVGWLDQGIIAGGIGAGKDGAGVRFADLNGDGRAEYLWVSPTGAVTTCLNAGSQDAGPNAGKVTWIPQGEIARGVGSDRASIVFADINGDGKADYLSVDRKTGAVTEYLNGGGPDAGANAAKVSWIPVGSIGSGVGTNGTGIQFADLDGDGRAEYIDINPNTSAVTAWLNGCLGVTFVRTERLLRRLAILGGTLGVNMPVIITKFTRTWNVIVATQHVHDESTL